MPVTVAQIRGLAHKSAVEVVLTDGRTFMIRAPEHVGGSPSGRQITLPSGEDGLVVVEAGDIAAVRVAIPDPEVEALRAGEISGWLRDRMRERPELFIMLARLDPEDQARVLGLVEG